MEIIFKKTLHASIAPTTFLPCKGLDKEVLKFIYMETISFAFGFVSMGFIQNIINIANKEDEKYFASLLKGIISYYKGDISNYNKYYKYMANVLDWKKDTKDVSKYMLIPLLLWRGKKLLNKLPEKHRVANLYKEIFERLFEENSEKAMFLHRLITMTKTSLRIIFEK
jgi:hypothetical protein